MEIQGYRISIGSRHHPNGQELYQYQTTCKMSNSTYSKRIGRRKIAKPKGTPKTVLNTTLSTLQEIPARKQWKPKVQSDILASSGPKRGSKSLALHPGIDSSETQWDERWHLR